jgi:predicted ATPase/DNA-binding winged helix-turn-helix (wHTH) protein
MGHEVSFGRHRFDPRAGRLWAGRREVNLTPRAAAVLGVLIERAGELVTRQELFRSVWGDTIVGDAALTACIQELRGALADDTRRPRFIETRHRRGYRFVARVLSSAPQGASSVSPAPAIPRPSPLLVGRDREVNELRAYLERATNGDRQIVFVTGEPGIGKTAAVELLLAEAASGDRLRIAQGRCIETHGAGEAYLPILEAMTRLCREPGGAPIARLLRRHAPTWLTQMPSVLNASELRTLRRQTYGMTRERMLRELAEAVEVMASDVPLVLWLEDLHWSDPSTVDWLGYLAKRPGPARILVLCSYRPEALTRGHPLAAVKDELKVHGHCRDVALTRLDETAVGEYLAHRFPAERAFVELAGMIHERTGGNPLFVVNVADDLVRRAVLIERAGRWEVEGSPGLAQIAIPEDVRRMIGHDLDSVHPDERRILEAASAAGVEFSAAAVAAAEQTGLDDVERRCAELARRASFLTSHGSDTWPDGTVAGRYGFRHALYQEVVYERMPAARRVELHSRIGERIEAGLRERAVEAATELAMHFERGRDPARAIRYLRIAGEIATQRSAAREAVAHLTRALDLLRAQPDTPERAEQEVALQIALGGPLMAIKGRGAPEVERAYARAQELCQGIGETAQLFPVLWGLFLFRRSRGEIDLAHGFGTRLLALARHTNDPGLLIEAHHALWSTLFARGELMAAQDHVDQAVALYEPERHASLAAVYGNHDAAVCALGHGAWALELSGEPEQASRRSEEAVARARTLGHPFSEAHALLYAARLHQFRGDWRTTRDHAEAGAVLAREQGFVQLQAWAAVTGGWALAEGGDVAEGLARTRDGVAAIRALGSEDFKTYFLCLLAETLAKGDETEAALDVLTEALGAVERTGERFYAAELHRQKGELLLMTGHDLAEVVRSFGTAVEIARHQRAWALERRALQSLNSVSGPPGRGA